MSEPVHLFLLVPNDSGSTWLQNIISLCRNCVAFSPGLDGKGVCLGTSAYPNQKINKLFSENSRLWSTPDGFDWDVIKTLWYGAWSQNPHWCVADPRVYLEKTPQAVLSSDMYFNQFDNVRFIIMVRNPYAVAEGTRRTIVAGGAEVSLRRCIRHWIACAKKQIYNYETYKDVAVKFTYEDLVGCPRDIEAMIH